ncbi:MAG: hypothetical protein J7J91_09695 [Deltaproteobacteria bacterium]|nr:hypothetical protein [Deltaproteobacteria bacterium]
MKVEKLNRRGDVRTYMAFVAVAIVICFAPVIVGFFENNSGASGFVEYWTYAENTTLLVGGGSHFLDLTNINPTADASLEVKYVGALAGDDVFVNGNLVCELDGTSPDICTVAVEYLSSHTNITYVTTGNITSSNLTYYTYANCDFDYWTCANTAKTYDKIFDAVLLIALVVLISAIVLVLSALTGMFG